MANATEACARLCDPAAEVSAHYLIARDGTLLRLVPEDMRAWHAGAGAWAGQGDVNSRSIGIELDNDGASPFSEPLMSTLERLLPQIMERWTVPPASVIGHSDMAPGRKIDPGPRFDWARLVRQGLAAPSGSGVPKGVSEDVFRSAALAAGYPADGAIDALLASVRLRHRPQALGPLCAADIAVLLV